MTDKPPADMGAFQSRVLAWMTRCFQRSDAFTSEQRSFRFVEEALELAQATGTTKEDVLRLVDYVYERPMGAPQQEIGGVSVTLAALATALGSQLSDCALAEIERCEQNTEKIRAKDLAKPNRTGALP